MKRGAAMILAGLTLLLADAANACSILLPQQRSGETIWQAIMREDKAKQISLWNSAESVFLARVVGEKPFPNGLTRFTLEPVVTLHGRQVTGRFTDDREKEPCGDVFIEAGDSLVVFRFTESRLPMGLWSRRTYRYVHPDMAYDPRVAETLTRATQTQRDVTP